VKLAQGKKKFVRGEVIYFPEKEKYRFVNDGTGPLKFIR
jgi:hypothetical protein